MAQIAIERARVADAPVIATMVGELLQELMDTIGVKAFNFSLAETTSRTQGYVGQEKYYAFLARATSDPAAGFIALYER